MNKNYSKFLISILFLLHALAAYSQVDHYAAVINEGEEWKYHIPSVEPSPDWIKETYDDSGWSSGPSGFGYGDSDDNTNLPSGTISVYIRKSFNVTEVSEVEEALFYIDYDDGFVAYLNGTEIARANVIGSPPAFNQAAGTPIEPILFQGGVPVRNEIDTNLLKKGSNTLAIQIHNQGATSSDMTAIPVLIFGINSTSDDYKDLPTWFDATNGFETNLPIVIIETESKVIFDEPKTSASFKIIYNGEGELNHSIDTAYEYSGFCGIEIRGETSKMFTKKSYDVEMWDELGNDIDTSFLHFPSEEDFVLYGPYSDKSLMNNVLGFRLANEMNNYASRTRYVELMLDGDYRGVYVLMEKIKRDKDRIDVSKLRPDEISGDDLTGGYIVRIDKGDNDGWFSQYDDYHNRGKLRFQYYYPDQKDIVDEQKAYIKSYFDDFEAAMFSSNLFNDKDLHYTDYIDLKSFVDNFIVNEISKNDDAYRHSTYFYKDKESKGGKLKAGYWDLNLAFGNIDFCGGLITSGWAFYSCPERGYPVWWDIMLKDTLFTNALNCRWTELRETTLHKDAINSLIDKFQLELLSAQKRNFDRWPIMGTYVWPNPGIYLKDTHEEIVLSLKNWINNRIDWIDQNIPGVAENCDFYDDFDINPKVNPEFLIANSGVEFNIYPNPAQSYVYIMGTEVIDEIKLVSLTGNLILHVIPGSKEYQLLLDNTDPGVYIMLISTKSGQGRQKIIISH